MLGIEGEGMWCPFSSDLSVYGSLIIRESESSGERSSYYYSMSKKKNKKEKMCFLLFCSHTGFRLRGLSHVLDSLGFSFFLLFFILT